MANVSEPLASTVQASFRELSATASEVNSVSDALGKFVTEIEDGLKSLNLGVASWVQIASSSSEDGLKTWQENIGFDKIGKNWCIALRNTCEAEYTDEYLEYDLWSFNEGPRWLRIKAVDHLPALLQKLNSDAQNIKKQLEAKLGTAAEVANGIKTVVDSRKAPKQGKTK
jgi:hypothetical protein